MPCSAQKVVTALCGAWRLFDLLHQDWRLQPRDFGQLAEVMAFVTGGRDRPSLYRDLPANLAKCLLAIRAR